MEFLYYIDSGENIGWNEGVAWTHTVSTAYRFTPYEYQLVPGAPTTYLTPEGPKALELMSRSSGRRPVCQPVPTRLCTLKVANGGSIDMFWVATLPCFSQLKCFLASVLAATAKRRDPELEIEVDGVISISIISGTGLSHLG